MKIVICDWVGGLNRLQASLHLCVCLSITCNREHSVEAPVSVRQMQPVAHLDLVSLTPGKVHQGATDIAPQLEHLLVDVEVLAIATTCQGQNGQLQQEWLISKRVTPTTFTHQRVFLGLLYYCICEKNSIKSFVAPLEHACNLINCLSDVTQWLSCIVGNVDSRFWKRKFSVMCFWGHLLPVFILTSQWLFFTATTTRMHCTPAYIDNEWEASKQHPVAYITNNAAFAITGCRWHAPVNTLWCVKLVELPFKESQL